MCGICCFIGHFSAYKYILSGLCMLQNRGYDSCGILTLNQDNNFDIRKFASTDDKPAINMISGLEKYFNGSDIGIGHTRWATHGPRTDENSHPHTDHTGKFAVVHNGIIENYDIIKKNLIEKHNVKFHTQTDTEVIVNLISHFFDELKDTEKAIHKALNRLEGTWGLVVISQYEPDKLFCARHGSPLLIGFSIDNDFAMISSEQCGFSKFIKHYIVLNDTDIVVIKKQNKRVYVNKKEGYDLKAINHSDEVETPYPYPHWTIKEINEQSDAIIRAIGMGSRIANDNMVRLGGLNQHNDLLIDVENLILLGCGTSYHAGLFAANIFKKISGFNMVTVHDGAEFYKTDIPKRGKTGIIFLSQSGETKDLHRCFQLIEDSNVGITMGVINVVDSLISREVDCGVYLNAGREVAVASTKSFASQVSVLSMIAVWFAQNKALNVKQRRTLIDDLRRLPLDIKNVIATCSTLARKIAEFLADKKDLFILGKGNYESIAKEASLKLKEIGYIHAEGYSSSALKHGTYSLVGSDTPIILLIPNDEHFNRNQGIAEELCSRFAPIIGFSDRDLNNKYKFSIKIPSNNTFGGILMMVIIQIISYEMAIIKGHNPDTPRNLAKVVTVD